MTKTGLPLFAPDQKEGSVYDYPKLYDVLFSGNNRHEHAFLCRVLQQFHGRETAQIFEPACGTGRLLWRLGKNGHETVGLDLNPNAIDFCNKRLRKHALTESAILGDMTDFSLRSLGRSRKFDLAFNLVSSFLHLTDEEEARKHLIAVASVLKKGGIYVLGFHLRPRGEALCTEESWVVRRGTLTIESHLERKSLDPRRRLETIEFRIKSKTPTRSFEVVDTFPLRTYTLAQFISLLNSVGLFDIVGTFDFGLDWQNPIRVDPTTEDVVFLLKRITALAGAAGCRCVSVR